VGCGVVAKGDWAAGEGTIVADPAHPANRGRLCSKGAALARTVDDGDRLLTPMIAGKPADWDAALALVAARFRKTIAEHGPDSVALYVSGQCLTEDYYVANKLMKGFIGSANIDTNSRLCMASSVAGHVRAFGEDVVPGIYEDWEEADLVVLVGSNTAWCHPVLHQRLLASRQANGTRVIVIDPRRTSTAERADMHLPIAAGTDVALFNGLLLYLAAVGKLDHGWIDRHAGGLDAALAAARSGLGMIDTHGMPDPSPPSSSGLTRGSPGKPESGLSGGPRVKPEDDGGDGPVDIDKLIDATAAACGIDPELLEGFFHAFAATERVLTVWSQGVNQAVDGTDRVNAIINCHLATGRIGRPGMGPFSVTGQPNAMGGREVGGLANQLAAHMRFDDPDDRETLRTYWDAPNLAQKPGLKAIELFDAVLDGRVKALWIIATNPAASLPRADRVRAALAACPFVVVSDAWPTDTTALAHVVLPATTWGEKDGTVTNSERRISRQRPFRAAPGEARPDWWQLAEVGRRMGWSAAFAWDRPAAIFREHASLSAAGNDGRRVFDIGALATLSDDAYDRLAPVRWPLPAGSAGEGGRLFAFGPFPTPDGRARIVATPWRAQPIEPDGLVLNTGRIRDQWHTMTRTGLVPALMTHTDEPVLTLHPADADRHGITAGNLARVMTDDGDLVLRAETSHAQRRGEAFAPMHWTDRFAAAGPVGRVIGDRRDPVSGQPALKHTSVTIAPVDAHFHGMLLRRRIGAFPSACHWVRVPLEDGQLFRLTGLRAAPTGEALTRFATALLDPPTGADWLEASDSRFGVLRVAVLVDGVLEACLFLAHAPRHLPSEASVIRLIGQPVPDARRARILAGRLGEPGMAEGKAICACFGVSRDAIRHAIVTHGLHDVAAIGSHLRAGTNCGSCIPELEEILRDVRVPAV